MRKIIYIAGAISSHDPTVMLCNIHRFAEYENQLMRAGFAPINPASDWQAVSLGGIGYEDVMERDRAMILLCDAVYFMYGWQESPGARREHKWAKAQGILCVEEPIVDQNFESLREALYGKEVSRFGTENGQWQG